MSFLTWLYGDSENAARAAAADAKLNELNQSLYGPGYVQLQNQTDNTLYNNPDKWVPPAQQEQQVGAAFDQGWQDGKDNIKKGVGGFFGVIGDALSSLLLGIPAWVWLVAGVGVWVWLGMPGLGKLKGKLK